MIGGGTRSQPKIPLGLMKMGRGPFVPAIKPLPFAPTLNISGITKDETGAATDGFTVYLFNMKDGTPVLVQTTVSSGGGLYSFPVGSGLQYWAAIYQSGSPDKAGATLNTLVGS